MPSKDLRLKLDGLNVVSPYEDRRTGVEASMWRSNGNLGEVEVHEGVAGREQAVERVPILCVDQELGAGARLLEDVQWQLQRSDITTYHLINNYSGIKVAPRRRSPPTH